MLSGHERTSIDEPMDTIFVKRVHANSPAAEAGLRTGDRVVSVDGNRTRGEQYASVVQRIQQAGPWLRLLVVSKEDDILQKVENKTKSTESGFPANLEILKSGKKSRI